MKKPFTNSTSRIMHMGPVTIMPFQTREVDELHIAGHTGVATQGAAAPEPEENPYTQMLKQKVSEIKKAINVLNDEELNTIEALENAEEKPRVGVINAIAEARLTRAAAVKKDDVDSFIASLDGMSDQELSEQKALYTDESDSIAYLEAVNTEIENRAKSED